MKHEPPSFDLSNQVVVITGGGGVLGRHIATDLARAGACIAVLDRTPSKLDDWDERLGSAGKSYLVQPCDVLDSESLQKGFEATLEKFGQIDALINAAGGNHPEATTTPDLEFFDLPREALEYVFHLNLLGTILPTQLAAREMARRQEGVVLNISSMAAQQPLTRVCAYSAAKAGVDNFTRWLAVHLAEEYSPSIRVNAVAPGFYLTAQNRFLLMTEEGNLTQRGQQIIDHTPMGRFGDPKDLMGAVRFLLSPASSFITGTVLPVDGGFQADSGV